MIFSVSKMNSLLQEKSTTNRFAICSTFERCFLAFLLTAGPGQECRCCPTVSLCVPTPHKPATLFIDKDWVQIRKQDLQVLAVIEASKYGGQTEA